MPLYQNSVLRKYLKRQDSEAVAKAFKKLIISQPHKNNNLKSILFTLFLSLTLLHSFGQLEPVDVAELTIKIGSMGTEEMLYDLAENI